MRSAFRLFMASILLTVAAGFAGAQEASEPPPPAPEMAVPVAELPPIPFASSVQDPDAPAVDPALTIDPSVLAGAPAAVAIVQAPEPEPVVLTTTARSIARNTAKQPVEKPVARPAIEATEAYGPKPMPAAAGVAAVSTVPGESNAPPPAAKSVIVETPADRAETGASMDMGSWILAGIAVAAMIGLITLVRRRRALTKLAVVEFPQFELKPLPATTRNW